MLASELQEATRDRRRGERFPVAVTLDDDDAAHVRTALPALREEGVRATFFLTGASLEGPSGFWFDHLQTAMDTRREGVRAILPPELKARVGDKLAPAAIHEISETVQRLPPSERDDFARRLADLVGADPPDAGLRVADVRALAAEGCEIGFHTLRHYALTTLDDDQLELALREGRDSLAEVAGRDAGVIAYPHGHADARVAAAARTAGFTAGFTTTREGVRPDSDPLLLGRLVPSSSSLGHLALQLARRLVPRPGR